MTLLVEQISEAVGLKWGKGCGAPIALLPRAGKKDGEKGILNGGLIYLTTSNLQHLLAVSPRKFNVTHTHTLMHRRKKQIRKD